MPPGPSMFFLPFFEPDGLNMHNRPLFTFNRQRTPQPYEVHALRAHNFTALNEDDAGPRRPRGGALRH